MRVLGPSWQPHWWLSPSSSPHVLSLTLHQQVTHSLGQGSQIIFYEGPESEYLGFAGCVDSLLFEQEPSCRQSLNRWALSAPVKPH
jgi:hypothetical protein